MTKTIKQHEGGKYLRKIRPALLTPDVKKQPDPIEIDVYCVLKAFDVKCPARQHAIKKLLCCGNRGKSNELGDLLGAEAAVSRAIDLFKEELEVFEFHTRVEIPVKQGKTDAEWDVTEHETTVNVGNKEVSVPTRTYSKKPQKEKPGGSK